jgi:Tfp pilus assembly protein PilO
MTHPTASQNKRIDNGRRSDRSRATLRIDIAGMAVALGLTACAYLFGVSPALARRELVAQQQLALDARKQEAVQHQQTLKALRRETDRLREALGRQPLTLLSTLASNERMDDLGRLVAGHGLLMHELTGSPVTSSQRFKLVPISISGRGTFASCSAFLHDLHTRYRDMAAWKIELADNPADRDGRPGELDFRFDLTWYAAP